MIRLTIVHDGQVVDRVRFFRPEITLGRSGDRSITLDPQGDVTGTVSRHHATITRIDEGYLLVDEKSSNGTFVNNRKVARHLLEEGDLVQIFPYQLRVSFVETSEDSAAAVKLRRPQRWDVPFSADMSEEGVNRVLAAPPFDHIDASKFPPSRPLHEILRNDCRLLRYSEGDLVVRQGDYGSSAFIVMSGSIRVMLDKEGLSEAVLGRQETRQRSWWEATAQLWRNSPAPEARNLGAYGAAMEGAGVRQEGDAVRIFLQDVPGLVAGHQTVPMGPGEIFGEMSALGRTPRTASIFADAETELLEIRWQGLREIRRYADGFREHIDHLYRERNLAVHLRETPLLSGLSEETIEELADRVLFETYGEFDWHGSYKKLASRSVRESLDSQPVIAHEGDYPDGLLLIRSGFARVSVAHGEGQRTVSYLSKGQVFGLEELLNNWKSGTQEPRRQTLSAVGYVDVLRVPTTAIEEIVLPQLSDPDLASARAGVITDAMTPSVQMAVEANRVATEHPMDPDVLEFLVENRYINGTATMMIDRKRCTRCDDCVRACAISHDGNPRFIRHGRDHGDFMIANACMHCIDPVCMIGCPTGAIHRERATGSVLINDITCIGCGVCANSCPYDAIRMVEIRDNEGVIVLDDAGDRPILKATKCDLCVDQVSGPSCANACPHDALIRMDMRETRTLRQWLER